MAIRVMGQQRPMIGRPAPVGPGHQRKVAILGTNLSSLQFAPYDDPSWEIWAHASIVNRIPKGAATLFIDLHPPHCFKETRKNGFKDYYGWLQHQTTPILMQETYPDIPAAMRFPRERIKNEWPNVPLGSQTAWMIALALIQGVTHIGLYGTHYAHDSEYRMQRANTERWVGIAEGRGVIIICPKENPLCHEPAEDYAYESHSTPEKYEALKKVFAESLAKVAFSDKLLVECETDDQLAEAARIRREKDPAWAREIAKIPASEKIPQGLLDMEERQRNKAAVMIAQIAEARTKAYQEIAAEAETKAAVEQEPVPV